MIDDGDDKRLPMLGLICDLFLYVCGMATKGEKERKMKKFLQINASWP